MGVVVNPYRFGAALPFILGSTGSGAGDFASNATNSMRGQAYQAPTSGTLKSLHIVGPASSATDTYSNFRLVVYGATSASAWGTKLGETVINSCLAMGETRDIPLVSNVSVASGDWIAVCVHTDRRMAWRYYSTSGGYSASDTFSDGAAATAGTTSLLSRIPVLWGSDGVASLSSTNFTLGTPDVSAVNTSLSGNQMYGVVFYANKTGPLNYVTVTGSSSASSAVDYRLAIYDATSATSWGAKLGETAIQNGLGISEIKKLALTSTVNVTAGSLYALCIHASANMACGAAAGGTGGRYSDTFSDGSAATAGAIVSVDPVAVYATSA